VTSNFIAQRFVRKNSSIDLVGVAHPTHYHSIGAHYHTESHAHNTTIGNTTPPNPGDVSPSGSASINWTQTHNHTVDQQTDTHTTSTLTSFNSDNNATDVNPPYVDVLYCQKRA